MAPVVPELARLAGDALVILLHLSAALSHLREGNVNAAVTGLTQVVDNALPGRYVDEAQFWRARIAESQDEPQARAAAVRDYVDMLKRLQKGPLEREIRARLAALTEPGRLLDPQQAAEASRRSLERIGRALHDYAADHGGEFPRALYDLLDGYLTDATVLVRPGKRLSGGARLYEYRPGLKSELRSAPDSNNAKAPKIDGVPVIVWEPAGDADGIRLILGIDGEVRNAKLPEQR